MRATDKEVITMNNEQKNNINPLVTALVGVVVGVAGMSAVALSDEDTRKLATKKAIKAAKNLKKWSMDTINHMQSENTAIHNEKTVELTEVDKVKVTAPFES
jgi:ribosomal 30S subunit maturation factor RimM